MQSWIKFEISKCFGNLRAMIMLTKRNYVRDFSSCPAIYRAAAIDKIAAIYLAKMMRIAFIDIDIADSNFVQCKSAAIAPGFRVVLWIFHHLAVRSRQPTYPVPPSKNCRRKVKLNTRLEREWVMSFTYSGRIALQLSVTIIILHRNKRCWKKIDGYFLWISPTSSSRAICLKNVCLSIIYTSAQF